jgi:hypothetical protein
MLIVRNRRFDLSGSVRMLSGPGLMTCTGRARRTRGDARCTLGERAGGSGRVGVDPGHFREFQARCAGLRGCSGVERIGEEWTLRDGPSFFDPALER